MLVIKIAVRSGALGDIFPHVYDLVINIMQEHAYPKLKVHQDCIPDTVRDPQGVELLGLKGLLPRSLEYRNCLRLEVPQGRSRARLKYQLLMPPITSTASPRIKVVHSFLNVEMSL